MGFDLVLCHFLLHYRPAEAGDIRRLAAVLRPGGRLSVIAPNASGSVLRALATNGPAAALEELNSESWRTETFDHVGRRVAHQEISDEMVAAELEVVALHGGRCANDILTDDSAKNDPEYYTTLERLELALCDREPFKRLGMFWQLVAEKPAS
jgi:S-adenosylmethionine-dependent methyltransferase